MRFRCPGRASYFRDLRRGTAQVCRRNSRLQLMGDVLRGPGINAQTTPGSSRWPRDTSQARQNLRSSRPGLFPALNQAAGSLPGLPPPLCGLTPAYLRLISACQALAQRCRGPCCSQECTLLPGSWPRWSSDPSVLHLSARRPGVFTPPDQQDGASNCIWWGKLFLPRVQTKARSWSSTNTWAPAPFLLDKR